MREIPLTAAALLGFLFLTGGSAPPPAPAAPKAGKELLRLRADPPAPPTPPPAPAPAPPAYDPKTPWVVPGLSLDPPQKRTKVGLAYVNAKVDKADSKSAILWDCECVWEDESVECVWEVRDGGRRLQVLLPDCSGVVRVSAWAVIDGKPTYPLAKTTIEMEYTPRKPPVLPPAPPPPLSVPQPKSAGAGKVVEAAIVFDPEGDANVAALARSVGLRNRLAALGVRLEVHEAGSAPARLARFVSDAGGAPALVLITDKRKVRKAVKCPATAEEVLALTKE